MEGAGMSGSWQLLVEICEGLTGQKVPLDGTAAEWAFKPLTSGDGLGYSQFNELLLLLGYDRVSRSFFQYLVSGEVDYKTGASLRSLEHLRKGVDEFRKMALLFFGNVKYAFKNLSRDAQELRSLLSILEERDVTEFKERHNPIKPIQKIPGEKTFYLGYLVQRELRDRLASHPEDREAKEAEAERERIVKVGIANHEAYLASDHLDIYVATSMRARHEYLDVSELADKIFGHPLISELKLRYFDPTQAYCGDRIDKGLAEALMLKRAKCTLYFAQESDTLGKDSELASTLAQGKPVIAFVPEVSDHYADELLAKLKAAYPGRSERELLLDQIRLFEPDAAWRDPVVRRWLDNMDHVDLEAARARLSARVREHYDRRARILRDEHPLGIQVYLSTGVANGVLVVRNVDQCAKLLRRVLTQQLEFELDFAQMEGKEYILLRETVSGCVYRVVTGDTMLTNAFWNFYLGPSE